MKNFVTKTVVIFVFAFLFGHQSIVSAEYILPYPSFMPGNKLYVIQKGIDKVKEYWSFGGLTKAKYFMTMSDKKLVEAKTLFEYKQYSLGLQALTSSSLFVQNIVLNIEKAKTRNINTTGIATKVCEEMRVHKDVLMNLEKQLPESFSWQEEKKEAVNLSIQETLLQGTIIREQIEQFVCL